MNGLRLRPFTPAILVLLANMAPSVARADIASDYLVGDYRVTDTGAGSGECSFSLAIEPDVGGEVIADRECEKSLPELSEAARWSSDGGSGFNLFDALRRPIAHGVEDEAGYVLILPDDRHLSVEAIDTSPPLSPDERTIGKWTIYLKASAPGQHVCMVEFRSDHTVAASGCGGRWAWDKARWKASEEDLRISPHIGKPIKLEWLDAATLGQSGADWAIVRE